MSLIGAGPRLRCVRVLPHQEPHVNARRSHPFVRRAVLPLIGVLALTIGASACGDDDGDSDSLTVYSGRSEELVGPLLDQFESSSGVDVNVRYGDSAEVALLVQQEGEASTAPEDGSTRLPTSLAGKFTIAIGRSGDSASARAT